MEKKSMLLVLLLTLVIVVIYVGFIASIPTEIEEPTAAGEVPSVVVPPSEVSQVTGQVTLVVV